MTKQTTIVVMGSLRVKYGKNYSVQMFKGTIITLNIETPQLLTLRSGYSKLETTNNTSKKSTSPFNYLFICQKTAA